MDLGSAKINDQRASINFLVFKNMNDISGTQILINCTNRIDFLCRNHELINILVNDCHDTLNNSSNHLEIKITDKIQVNTDTINLALQLNDLYVPSNMKSLYDSLLLMEYLMSDQKLKGSIEDFLIKYIDNNNKWTEKNLIYSMAAHHKLFGYIDHTIFNKIKNFSFMKDLAKSILNNDYQFDNKFIAQLCLITNEQVYLPIEVNEKENNLALERFKILFNDLIEGLDFEKKFVIAGGSINICLDSRIQIVQNKNSIITDMDIFLIGNLKQQKRGLSAILLFFANKFGPENIYICDVHSIKYVWINDTSYHVQIIGTLHNNGYQLVNYFDMTHLKCWFDGKHFYKTLDCHLSIESKITYALILPLKKSRVYKTMCRGYKIVPINYIKNFFGTCTDALSSYDLKNYESEEVDKYTYVINNYHKLLPKSNNDMILNKMNMSFMIGRKFDDIFNLKQMIDRKINYNPNFKEINDRRLNDQYEIQNNLKKLLDKKKYSNNNQSEDLIQAITMITNNHKIAMDILNSYRGVRGKNYVDLTLEPNFITNEYCDMNFYEHMSLHINSNFIFCLLDSLKVRQNINDKNIFLNNNVPEYVKNSNSNINVEEINTKVSTDDESYEIASYEVDIGYVVVSNVFSFEYINSVDSYNTVKFMLLVNEQKYTIYAVMQLLCNIIKKLNGYDVSRVNIAQKFTNVPYPLYNYYKDYLGNYLICATNILLDDTINQQKFAIGNIVQITLRFLLDIEYENNIKYVKSIIPKFYCYSDQ